MWRKMEALSTSTLTTCATRQQGSGVIPGLDAQPEQPVEEGGEMELQITNAILFIMLRQDGYLSREEEEQWTRTL
jgi:hypothetical protein